MTFNIPLSHENFEQITPDFFIRHEDPQDIIHDIRAKLAVCDILGEDNQKERIKKRDTDFFFHLPDAYYAANALATIYEEMWFPESMLQKILHIRKQLDMALKELQEQNAELKQQNITS